MSKFKFFAAAAVAAAAIGGGAALAAVAFSDVPSSHDHYADIERAVEEGWFSGYPDGTFKPDKQITPKQIATVVERAFAEGLTRAETATVLRAGADALLAIRCPAGSVTRPAAADCPAQVGDWKIELDAPPVGGGVGCRWSLASFCDYANYWHVNVLATNTGDDTGEPPSTYRFKLFVNGVEWGNRSSDCADTRKTGSIGPGLRAGYQVCFGADEPPMPANTVLEIGGGWGSEPAYRALTAG